MTKALPFLSACALGAAFTLFVAPGPLHSQDVAPAGAPPKSPWVESSDTRPAEQAYKNIKVFTGLPANRLEAVMKNWKSSLGVECTFCHVRDEWDSDQVKHKETARFMKTMTDGIAKSYFNGETEVTCYTCHRGEKHPAKNPPAAPVRRQPRPVAPGTGL